MATPTSKPSLDELAALLAVARKRAEAGNYQDALSSVRDAKRLHDRNVYLLAFERQLEQLTELSLAGTLGDDERTDILDSIPGIVERALEGASAPLPAATAPDAAAAERARAERAAAHEWLKNQYFQHAHEYVKKGEYDHALAEIRRVFIIDPESKIARDFEQQITELERIRRETVPIPAEPGRAEASGAAPPPPGDTRVTGSTPSSPGEHPSLETPAATHEAPADEASKPRRLKPLSLILLFIALALLAFATIFLIKKLEAPSTQTPRSTIPSPAREQFAPEQPTAPADSAVAPGDTSAAS
jgi:tetratricopeptide (TPR) repeat protein